MRVCACLPLGHLRSGIGGKFFCHLYSGGDPGRCLQALAHAGSSTGESSATEVRGAMQWARKSEHPSPALFRARSQMWSQVISAPLFPLFELGYHTPGQTPTCCAVKARAPLRQPVRCENQTQALVDARQALHHLRCISSSQ